VSDGGEGRTSGGRGGCGGRATVAASEYLSIGEGGEAVSSSWNQYLSKGGPNCGSDKILDRCYCWNLNEFLFFIFFL